jgi:DNA-binding transcriptional LysR family regulator
LFERTSRGVRLLPAGATLLPRARAILTDIAAMAGAVRRSRSESDDGDG